MSTPVSPRDLQLPPSQRAQFAFTEQRKQNLKEHMLKRRNSVAYKQEDQILSSSRNQSEMMSDGQVQDETKAPKLETKMADKENVKRPTKSKNNKTMEKNYIPLKPFNEFTNTTVAVDTHNLEKNNQTLQSLPMKDEPPGQCMTLSQRFHSKNNNKKKQVTAEKPKQDANVLKKPVLGSYRGHIVQSKVNSFRKPAQVKDESSAVPKKLSEPQPANTSIVPGKSHRAAAVMSVAKHGSTASQDKRLLRPPIRGHYDNTHNAQDSLKRGISSTSAHVTFRKGSCGKELVRLNTVLSTVQASSAQEVKRNKTLSRSITSEIIAMPASSCNTKLVETSNTVGQRRHTIAKATIDSRSAQPKETAEERKARLSEWRASKGRTLKRPPSAAVPPPSSEGSDGTLVGSFWTIMAEEDEQRLFTEKINKTFSKCLDLINKGCPKEEILDTLNDLIKNIPDAKKLVKYWICLALIEPPTSSIENIISIYEKAILAGAQPIEEMRHAVVDILTMKSQDKVKFGENFEETCTTKEQIQEVNTEETGVNVESGKPEMESKHRKNVVFQGFEKEEVDKTRDATNDVKSPQTDTKDSCLIKYNVSSTPYLKSVKKKMLFDEVNSTFKELKFVTPVRRSGRLQGKTSTLPDMLKEHSPCVTSLEELTELGDETDAFVCLPNAALCRMHLETEKASEK